MTTLSHLALILRVCSSVCLIFLSAGDNLNVQALAEYELRVTFNAPASLYPIHPDAVTIR